MPAIKGAERERREGRRSPGSSTLDSHSAKRGERADFEIGMVERRGETQNHRRETQDHRRRCDRICSIFVPNETNMGEHIVMVFQSLTDVRVHSLT